MEYRRLGKTELNVSILSLGSGGPNRFGQVFHVSAEDITRLVRLALEFGINFFDTASVYGESESILGKALQGVPRDRYLVSTKILPMNRGRIISAAEARRQVEQSLQRLGVEELDILHLHRVIPDSYEDIVERLMPELENLCHSGKVRYIGISEASGSDPHHRMLKRALQDDHFDTVMVAYSLANSGAEKEVFPLAVTKDVGVIGMVAARHLVTRNARNRIKLFSRALTGLVTSPARPDKLKSQALAAMSALRRPRLRQAVPIAREGGQESMILPGAAYTFALSHPAIATVLSGTVNPDHLQQNVAAALAPSLTSGEIERLRMLLD